jgi:hypothetical protein
VGELACVVEVTRNSSLAASVTRTNAPSGSGIALARPCLTPDRSASGSFFTKAAGLSSRECEVPFCIAF